MEIRVGNSNDLMQVREIWNHCFGNDAFADWFFAELYDVNCLRVLTVGQTVVSMAFCFPRQIASENGVLNGWYLYGIGTLPSARGNGYARYLIEACIAEAREQALDLCFLIPAEESLFSYYQKVGFSKRWTRDVITSEKVASQTPLTVRLVSEDDLALLGSLYEAEFPLRVCRNRHDWNLILDEFRMSNGDAVLLYEKDTLIGYAFFYEYEDVTYIRELALCDGFDPIDVCHTLCKTAGWKLTKFGDTTDFAMAYPLTKHGESSANVYCDLLYN